MEEIILNFNAPFLSTRRLSTTNSSLPRRHNGKMKDNSKPNIWPALAMDQVTEPASVPFTWEQIPGKPKVMDILKHSEEKDIEEQNISRTPADAMRLLSLKEELNEKGVSDSEDEEAYSDDLDMLSSKGSFSVICSISGVSGYDNNETEKPVTISSDPEARDFMLNRFLPAAKAMTLDKPHYSKKQQTILASPQPRLIREIVPMETKLPVTMDRSIVISHYDQRLIDEAGTEDEDEDEDEDGNEISRYIGMASLSRRGCGLLPRICSLPILNPVEDFKIRAGSFVTSTNKDGKLSRASKLKSHIQSVKKIALAAYKQKPGSKAVEDDLSCGSDQFGADSIDKLTASRPSSPYRHSGCMSPYRSAATCSAFRPAGFPGTLKEAENLRANRLNNHIKGANMSQEFQFPRTTKQSSSSIIPVMEKTLYVDTENPTEPKAWHTSDSETDLAEPLLDEADKIETIVRDNLRLEGVKSLGSSKLSKEDDAEKTGHGYEVSLLAPPLPKMPTESWLLRNLSYPASRKSFSGSSPGSRFHHKQLNAESDSNGIPRWETIVKTSFLHKDHVRYSEELIPRICHHQSLT